MLVSRMRLFSYEKGLACLNLDNNIPRPSMKLIHRRTHKHKIQHKAKYIFFLSKMNLDKARRNTFAGKNTTTNR